MDSPRTPLFDVIEVSDADPNDVRLIAEAKDERNAEAIIGMAVLRRGMKHSYFTKRPHARLQSTDPSPGEPNESAPFAHPDEE